MVVEREAEPDGQQHAQVPQPRPGHSRGAAYGLESAGAVAHRRRDRHPRLGRPAGPRHGPPPRAERGPMSAYIIRRLLYAIPILVGVNLITFVLFFVVNSPDDMAVSQLGAKYVTPEAIE